MLETIGVDDIETLFDEIPESLRTREDLDLPPGMTEMEVTELVRRRARADGELTCFAGAGAYDHHVPAAVWQIATRGEFYSAYTPYQAEASQGTLQLIYEYQTMMARLTGMDVSNASLYDGASGLGEAVLMAIRANRKCKSRRVLVPRSVHPAYRKTAHTLTRSQGIELVDVPLLEGRGTLDTSALDGLAEDGVAAVVIQQPNYFGGLEDVAAITDWAHANGALVIAVANPLTLAALVPPGEWGEQGADIACGEGQPLGAPLSAGGPYFGYMCCRKKFVRQMPGRIVGRTVDADGREGFVLTLQAREQHIRRSKATSNICTNQGLLVTAATIHMSLLGDEGLERVAGASFRNTRRLAEALCEIDGVEPLFEGPSFHEVALRVPRPAQEIIEALAEKGFLAGVDLAGDYPELGDALLVCATEKRSDEDIQAFAGALAELLA